MAFNLYIDTSGQHSVALLFNQDTILAQAQNPNPMDHGKWLHPALEGLMKELPNRWKDLEAVYVMNGPGSYTGLRVALSAAKGICFACGVPLFLMNRLDWLKAAATAQTGRILVLMRAREDEYFTGAYEGSQVLTSSCLPLKTAEVEDWLVRHHGNLVVGEESLLARWPQAEWVPFRLESLPTLALKIAQEGDLLQSEPFYGKNVHINKINKL